MPFPENPIDLSPPQEFMDPRISVGRHTYGLTQDSFVLVQPWERIEIGSYCSFAEEVKLFGGAEHEAGISTFPIASKLIDPFGEHLDAATKGPLRIGNDCWVGMGAKVLSGVTIGDGAIVGAGAVVTRDVPPYAVVAGNPARVVRMRFDEHTVERLLEMRWWDWDEDEIMRRAHLLKDADAFLASIDQPPPLSGSPDPGPELLSPYRRYCDLLAHSLVGLLAPDPHSALAQDDGTIEIVPLKSRDWREIGYDWPVEGETMVGLKRLDNIRECVLDVIRRKVPGHLIETGVWRGGSTIFMRALLRLYGVSSRRVYVADSFQGLPEPDASAYPADAGDRLYAHDFLRVSEDEVRGNFARYGLLDDQVCFVPGWFRDTLPQLEGPFAVIRLDGDMYESTMVALESLYPKLSDGGYCIVDDFVLDPCREAVEDYRARQGVTEPIQQIDWTGAYWQKRPPA